MTAVIETPTSTKNEIQLSGLDLARVVSNVLPLAGTDQTLPVLNAVFLTLEAGTLTAITTDRYTMGVDSFTVDGSSSLTEGVFTFLLRKADALKLVSTVKTERWGVSVSVDDGKLTVRTFDASLTFTPQDGQFPAWERLLVEPDETAEPVSVISFNPAYLAKFAKVKAGRNPYMTMKFNALKPAYITIGDTFRGLIMPVRIQS